MIKIFNKICLIIFFLIVNTTYSFSNVFIDIKVNNEIITNYDIYRELEYLKILNPNLNSLNKIQIYELAKNSLINEIIKKNEIKKKFDINTENSLINDIFANLIQRINIKDEESFQKILDEKKSYSIKEIKDKLKIELLWNDLIFINYKNLVFIDKKKLSKKIEDQSKSKKYKYFLSEIIFKKKKEQDLKDLISLINESIIKNGFNNTANIFSISESSKFGGKIGWIDEDNLPENISNNLNDLKVGDFTNVININNNYIIVKIEDKELIKSKLNKEEELKKLINYERNRQLNQFSNIYFSKVKLNYNLDEK